jgi:hypothetical protein
MCSKSGGEQQHKSAQQKGERKGGKKKRKRRFQTNKPYLSKPNIPTPVVVIDIFFRPSAEPTLRIALQTD